MRRSIPVTVLLTVVLATTSAAQDGAIAGRLTAGDSGRPIASALVEILGTAGRAVATGLSDQDGRYRIGNLAPASYSVSASAVGFATRLIENVSVTAGGTATVDAALEPAVFELNPVVVSVSKQQQKAVDAPATVAVVDERAIEARPAVTPVDHLRGTVGVDVISQGVQSTNVVVRGFNNIFSGALHTLTDNRIAGVPSLRVNLMHFIPMNDEDIERMEVVLGPGSALYGPNTANGVLHIITKSPLTSQGTTISVAGGERDVFLGEFRTAQLVSPDLGVKVSGQYLRGNEWKYTDPVEQAARELAIAGGDPDTRIGLRDFDIERWSVDGRADWRVTPDLTAILSVGHTNEVSGIELTGIGAGQVKDWTYDYYQLRANYKRFFAQTYLNASNAGDTFLLRDGTDIVDRSKVFVAQIQHGFKMGTRQDFIYGADYIRTMPVTDGTINGVNEDSDDIDEIGGYVQSQTSLGPKLDLVLAARLDKHSKLPDPVFSPRAGLVFKPARDQSVRLTYNRAFSTPTALNLFLDISGGPLPNPQLAALGYGIRAQAPGDHGFRFRVGGPTALQIRSPFNPGGAAALLDANSTTLLHLAAGVLQARGAIDAQTAQLLGSLTPTDEQVGVVLLDLSNPTAAPVPQEQVVIPDVSGIRESITNNVEVGYTGVLGQRVLITADAWYSRITNFTSPLVAQGGYMALLNGPRLGAYLAQALIAAGVPPQQAQAQATALATGMAQIPLGVVSSRDVAARGAELLVTYINFGEVELGGADLALTALLTDRWSLGLNASLVSDDHFETDGQFVALNAPKRKGSATLTYDDDSAGFRGAARVRYNSEFPANSAGYVGTQCVLGAAGTGQCVDAYTLFDLTLDYRLPRLSGASLQLSVQNLFDADYRSFIGVPAIGRFALLRLRYEF